MVIYFFLLSHFSKKKKNAIFIFRNEISIAGENLVQKSRRHNNENDLKLYICYYYAQGFLCTQRIPTFLGTKVGRLNFIFTQTRLQSSLSWLLLPCAALLVNYSMSM